MGPLEGKGALVTGGGRGIGRAIALRLVADGAAVVFGYLQDDAAADDVVAQSGGRATAVRVDLGEPGGVVRLFESAEEHLDGLDILVNNAATVQSRLINEVTEDEYDRIMAVNAKGVFLAVQQAALRLRDGGRIVNLSSINTVLSGPGIAVYAASKAAVEQFTKVAAFELGRRSITVNTVSPGATDTEMLRSANTEDGLRQMVAMTALGRLGQPADIADVVGFLVGPDGRWITGHNLIVSGGLG